MPKALHNILILIGKRNLFSKLIKIPFNIFWACLPNHLFTRFNVLKANIDEKNYIFKLIDSIDILLCIGKLWFLTFFHVRKFLFQNLDLLFQIVILMIFNFMNFVNNFINLTSEGNRIIFLSKIDKNLLNFLTVKFSSRISSHLLKFELLKLIFWLEILKLIE